MRWVIQGEREARIGGGVIVQDCKCDSPGGSIFVNVRTPVAFWNGTETRWRATLGKGLLSYYYSPTEELDPDFRVAVL